MTYDLRFNVRSIGFGLTTYMSQGLKHVVNTCLWLTLVVKIAETGPSQMRDRLLNGGV